ncbi:MAG: HAMP domain-containing histidine kinase [Paraglaciecola sp.]|uniref:sensor histidine kinase n=1 Tax=Paraglaciecola sp. TaxID=1920173 RepID=UPI00273E8C56|nr:HAMP domain-containing sensor histidine kinase [Paraglaciecola sp.]MDP5032286.1 HAMP domain-containing histidine kinase [Paraglaciecola sp.]MDP5134223.1 HAMP domain-containing histidine kinase [Paraglaciecola sp.]
MMKLCFYQRLSLSVVLVMMSVMFGLFWLIGQLQNQTKLEAEQKLHLGLAEHLLVDAPLLAEGNYELSTLKDLFHTLMIMGPNFEFYYLDPQGNILAYSAEPQKILRKQVGLKPILQLIDGNTALPLVGDDPRQLQRKKIFSAAPVYRAEQLQGYLYVIIGGEIYDSILANIQNNHKMRELALFMAAGLIFLLVMILVLFKFFTKPLQLLSEDMETICAADFKREQLPHNLAKWDKDSHNEVHRLGQSFTKMLSHIEQQFSALQHIDDQRRMLLADLSHDLRTPLASLQGYIETLALNPDSISANERKRFIDISLKNAKNLKHLIDQIFELTYLESGQVTLNQESFPLAELLQDVAAKFAIKANHKSIAINVSDMPLNYRVFADIDKLERVLSNLIDNAIRHTPHGGQISLQVLPQKESLRVNIKDTGIGISDKELAYIFDARYQATNSAKDNTLHTGLGLAISCRLMALLNSKLTVESQLGQGTCFSFELKTAH